MDFLPSFCLLFLTIFTLFSPSKSENTDCLDEFPFTGLHRLRYAFDVTSLDVFPTSSPSRQPHTPVFAFTCKNASHKWNYINGESGLLPDQIKNIVFHKREDSLTGGNEAFSSVETFQSTLKSFVNMQTATGNVPSSWSQNYAVAVNSERFLYAQANILNERTLFWSWNAFPTLIVTMGEPVDPTGSGRELILSEVFEKAIQNMTGRRYEEKTKEKFISFFTTFGTHYFEEVNFGLYALMEMTLEDAYYAAVGSNKISEIMEQYQNYYVKVKKNNYNKEPLPAIASDEDFQKEALAEKNFTVGGFSNDGYSQVFLGASKPVPISGLIEDDQLAGELDAALEDYMAKEYLGSLVRSLNQISQVKEVSWMLNMGGAVDLGKTISRLKDVLFLFSNQVDAAVKMKVELEEIRAEALKFITFAEMCKISKVQNIVQ